MASKKNCILKVVACFGAVAVLCTLGAFVFASAEELTIYNYSLDKFYYAVYNSGNKLKGSYTYTDFETYRRSVFIPSSSTNGPVWALFEFISTITDRDDYPEGTYPLIKGFTPGNSYDLTITFNFSIRTYINMRNDKFNWLAIKQYVLDNLYLGNDNVYYDHNNWSGPVYSGAYHYLLNTIENLEIKESSLSVGEPVAVDTSDIYYPCSFSANIFFTVPSDWNISDIQYLHAPLFFTRSYFTDSYACYFDFRYLTRLRLSGYEYTEGSLPGDESSEDTSDPGGGGVDTSDNGVSDIVEGQKEAVEHGQDLEQSKAQAELDDQNENLGDFQSVFNVTTLGSSFGNLLQGLMYSGQDFSFKFPGSGNIPYLDQNQELWQELEIPFKTYIDAIPSSIMVIIRFLSWFALAVYLFHLFKKVLSYFRGGSDD